MVTVHNQWHAVPEYHSLQDAVSGDRCSPCLCCEKAKLPGHEVDSAQDFSVALIRSSHAMEVERPDRVRSFEDLSSEVLVGVQFLGI